MVLLLAMGITKLADLIRLDAPGAISHKDIGDYTGNIPDLAFIFCFTCTVDLSHIIRRWLMANVSILTLPGTS